MAFAGRMTMVIAVVTAAASALAIAVDINWVAPIAAFIPARVSGLVDVAGALPWWLTPFSSALLHAGWLHLIVNMVMLLLIGRQVERVVGKSGLLMAYVVGALAAAAAQWAIDPSSTAPMVGASGAISAIFGLYGIFFGRPPQVSGSQKLNRAVHIAWLLAAWIIIQLLNEYMAGTQGVLLATPAHIGGFVAGLLLHRPLLLWHYRRA
jgi:membrane associated rhomboid family serine protease